MLLIAGSAFAATSGTPMDTVATQVMQLVSGPIALLMIIAGFIGAGLTYFLGRNFEWHLSHCRRWRWAGCWRLRSR